MSAQIRHSLAPPSRFTGARLAVLTLGAALATGSCRGDNIPARVRESLMLVPVTRTVKVKPGGTSVASFRLTTSSEAPVGGERLQFMAVDNPDTPGSELAGATLSAFSDVTNADGVGSVSVTGGMPTAFFLTASHADVATATAEVVVTPGDPGTVAVVPYPASGARAALSVTKIDLLLFTNVSCADLSAVAPPTPLRLTQAVAPGMPAEFSVDPRFDNAFVGQGRDAGGTLQAVGCIEVPASTVVGGNTVRAFLPLSDLIVVPRGTFALSSTFSLARRDLVRRVAAPWTDLADCPLDPGQLWLDCAIDALSTGPDDPVDCVPAAAGAGEGPLANAIGALRGSATVDSPCRAATLPGGSPSLDAKLAALFPSPAQPPASALDMLGTDIAAMFNEVHLASTLALEPAAGAGVAYATHTLRTISFSIGQPPAMVDIVAEGIPNSSVRFVRVTTVQDSQTTDDVMTVDMHGLGLHLGTLARAAFTRTDLAASNGAPGTTGSPTPITTTASFLDLLFGLAASGTGAGARTGCDALDSLVCAQVGQAEGCLRAACVAGQAALAARLDAGFALADGDGDDLQLSGSAVMIDDNGDGFVDRLGPTLQSPGLWTAQIRAHAGTETVSGSWTGMLEAP